MLIGQVGRVFHVETGYNMRFGKTTSNNRKNMIIHKLGRRGSFGMLVMLVA